MFPQSAALPGTILAALAIRQTWATAGTDRLFTEEQKADLLGALRFLAYLLGALLISLVIGQKIALTAFVVVFLRTWTERTWRFCLGYGLLGWAVMALFYDRLLQMFWEPSFIGELIMDAAGKNWPSWILF